MLFKSYALAALTLTLPMWTNAATLAPPVVEASVTVNYSDLNVNTLEGASTLLARIRTAARTACSASFDNRAVLDLCMRESTERALAQVNRPMVTALYKGNVYITVARAN